MKVPSNCQQVITWNASILGWRRTRELVQCANAKSSQATQTSLTAKVIRTRMLLLVKIHRYSVEEPPQPEDLKTRSIIRVNMCFSIIWNTCFIMSIDQNFIRSIMRCNISGSQFYIFHNKYLWCVQVCQTPSVMMFSASVNQIPTIQDRMAKVVRDLLELSTTHWLK